MSRRAWDKPRILAKLRALHKEGVDLSYNAAARKLQALVSAGAYHFGSYRRAVEAAGIDYSRVVRRPRWGKPQIIQLIKAARRRGEDLHWSAVTKRRDELGRAAFASLQPRLFKRWDRALQAAGLDADDISQYRSWDRNSIVFELRLAWKDGGAVNSGAVQKDDPGLHAAAVRRFGTYEKALRAAKIDVDAARARRRWSRQIVLKELRKLRKRGSMLSATILRRDHSALYAATVRLFGTLPAAREAIGVKSLEKRARTKS